MEMESGKLFIGGISWDTTEERLKDYFGNFGEVAEAMVMKDRATGRNRGFGFVVFADPAIAERVVLERHVIDGRTVEAKKAVPRDDQNILNRNNTSTCVSPPGPLHTKKIFVGGLASTVTENDFEKYFDQFGTITDVVVMYDHNTQRPRGFGFITYDTEEAVENVLYKTFHELNGKMVEVKKAVPKESSPGPSKNLFGPYNSGLGRNNSSSNGYTQGFKQGSVGGYSLKPSATRETCSRPDLEKGLFFGTGLTPNYGETANLRSSSHIGKLNGYSNASPTSYSIGNSSLSSLSTRNLWGNGNYNYLTNSSPLRALTDSGSLNAQMGSLLGALTGSGSLNGEMGSLIGFGKCWDSFNTGHGGTAGFPYSSDKLNNGIVDKSFGSVHVDIERNYGTNMALESSYEGAFSYGDPTWRSSVAELDHSSPYLNRLGNAASFVKSRNFAGCVGFYGIADIKPDRGAFSYGDPTWRSSVAELDHSSPYLNHLGNAASFVKSRNFAGCVGFYGIADIKPDREIAT